MKKIKTVFVFFIVFLFSSCGQKLNQSTETSPFQAGSQLPETRNFTPDESKAAFDCCTAMAAKRTNASVNFFQKSLIYNVREFTCNESAPFTNRFSVTIGPDLSFFPDLSFVKKEESDVGLLGNICKKILEDKKAILMNSENAGAGIRQFKLTRDGNSIIRLDTAMATKNSNGKYLVTENLQMVIQVDNSNGPLYQGLVKGYQKGTACPSGSRNGQHTIAVEFVGIQ